MSRLDDIDTFYVSTTGRHTYYQRDLDEYDRNHLMLRPQREQLEKSNLVSSQTDDDRHKPVIDCDYPIQAIASSTPGHFHLYIEQELTWAQYRELLTGFYKAGLIQKAWYENALKDKRSYVRLPHIHKSKPEPQPQKELTGQMFPL